MSNSSQEFSFGGSPPRACPGTVGESPPQEGNSPEQISSDSYEAFDNSAVVQVEEVQVITPTSSRSASPAGAFVGDASGGPAGGGSSGGRRGDGNDDKKSRRSRTAGKR